MLLARSIALLLFWTLTGCSSTKYSSEQEPEQNSKVVGNEFCRIWQGEQLGPNEKLKLVAVEEAAHSVDSKGNVEINYPGAYYRVVPIHSIDVENCVP